MAGWDFAHVQNDVNPHIVRMLEGMFSLDAARIREIAIVPLLAPLKGA